MAFTTQHGNAVINLQLNTQLSLHTSDPGPNGDQGELTGGSYARQDCVLNSPANKQTANNNTATFDALPQAIVSHCTLWDGVTAMYTGPLPQPIDIGSGESLQFGPGDVTLTLT